MLTAEKKLWFDMIFSVYSRNLFKRRFHAVRIENLEYIARRDKDIPLVIYANHSSWWDGLVFYELFRAAEVDGFIMMEEKQLVNLQLFRKLGVFSIVREKPREALKSINYAVNILSGKKNRSVLIFPQGEIKPNDVRPLGFYNGISKIVEKLGNCNVLPVVLRYEFLSDYKPEIYVKIGGIDNFKADDKFSSAELTKELEIKLTNLLNLLRSDIAMAKTANYARLI